MLVGVTQVFCGIFPETFGDQRLTQIPVIEGYMVSVAVDNELVEALPIIVVQNAYVGTGQEAAKVPFCSSREFQFDLFHFTSSPAGRWCRGGNEKASLFPRNLL